MNATIAIKINHLISFHISHPAYGVNGVED